MEQGNLDKKDLNVNYGVVGRCREVEDTNERVLRESGEVQGRGLEI